MDASEEGNTFETNKKLIDMLRLLQIIRQNRQESPTQSTPALCTNTSPLNSPQIENCGTTANNIVALRNLLLFHANNQKNNVQQQQNLRQQEYYQQLQLRYAFLLESIRKFTTDRYHNNESQLPNAANMISFVEENNSSQTTQKVNSLESLLSMTKQVKENDLEMPNSPPNVDISEAQIEKTESESKEDEIGQETGAGSSPNYAAELLKSFVSGDHGARRRKTRTAFDKAQISQLERRFHKQKYLTPTDRDDLANELHLSPSQVITWYQNRRAKFKRDLEERHNDIRAAISRGEIVDLDVVFSHQKQPEKIDNQSINSVADDTGCDGGPSSEIGEDKKKEVEQKLAKILQDQIPKPSEKRLLRKKQKEEHDLRAKILNNMP